jgi:alcohol dehydrogenase class IV
MRFEFAAAARIIFGPGTAGEVAPLAAEMGKSAFVVTGRTAGRAAALLEDLEKHSVKTTDFSVVCEPTTAIIKAASEKARGAGCDMVIAIGGGSVLDAGKAVAAMLTNRGDLEDYLEVIGGGRPLARAAAPCIAIPTTAGTGAEVTRNSVIASPEHRVKVSIRSASMLPRLAVVDPQLTLSMGPALTAATGLDALTQLVEAFVSRKANPLTDGICIEGIRAVSRSLRAAFENGADLAARCDMSLASLFGGFALANAGLGAVHGFAGPLGGMTGAAHGAICAAILPHACSANIEALRARAPDSPAAAKYIRLARLLAENPSAAAGDAARHLRDLCRALKAEPLSKLGLRQEDFPAAVEKAKKASSMKGNPVELTDAELAAILDAAWEG